ERGLVNKLKFEDIGAKNSAARRKEVDTFTFLRNLKSAGLNGPIFDFYYENLGDFFSAQLTGDRASGKELINRKYADLGTYIKGMGQSMGALNKIVDGVKSFNAEDLKKAEGAFLGAVNEAASTFESYNSEAKRHEIAYHLMLQWIMMGRIPKGQGFDLRFSPWGLPMIRELNWHKKSLAELVGDMGNGLINSAMVYDTQETENFIFEAQRKGVLPINRDGKTLQAVEKRRQAIGKGAFTRVFDNVDVQITEYEKKMNDPHRNILQKVVGIPEHLGYQLYKGLQKFGNGAVDPTLARDDKYQWSAGRMLELTGASAGREFMQIGVYSFYFMILLLLLAAGNGAKELDIK
ncbi:MAG: hypothetical protein NUV52_04645, partial [Candidatus Roizmanbacteria bacterium]|nr:hypothetical protein [Candidatus Roizmanbacteria bacterium]